ncbi:MAG: PilZ domain-containing protein [Myxococcota bacterium]|nr:PilZ domain-containing protein [Myxococcota bacterium]
MQPRAPRYRVGGLNFIYDTGDSSWAAPIVDVSESGIFLSTSHQLPAGTRVKLVPDVPEHEKLAFEIIGEVVRVNELDNDATFTRPPGIGFRLLNLQPPQYTELKRFLEARDVLVRPPKF